MNQGDKEANREEVLKHLSDGRPSLAVRSLVGQN